MMLRSRFKDLNTFVSKDLPAATTPEGGGSTDALKNI